LISYREGNPEQTIEWANKAGLWGPPGTLALLVRAMSEHQLGQTDTAKATLALAAAKVPVELRSLGTNAWTGPLPISAESVGFDWQVSEIIRREAAAVISVATVQMPAADAPTVPPPSPPSSLRSFPTQ
jgi:hypothetical protein